MVFKGVPEFATQEILGHDHQTFTKCFRAIRHSGSSLFKEDFLPTFADPAAVEAAAKGRMANVVVNNSPNDKDITYWSLSLFDSVDSLNKRIRRNAYLKTVFPAIAVGKTDDEKGVAWREKGHHIVYFLYDYETDNPCIDFSILENIDGE